MLKDIKVAMMTRIAQKNEVVGRWVGNHGPLVIEKLPKNMAKVTWWRVVFNGDDGYEVKCGWKQLKVNIARRTCTCKSWDLTSILCCHVVCAFFIIVVNLKSISINAIQRSNIYRLTSTFYSLLMVKMNGQKLG